MSPARLLPLALSAILLAAPFAAGAADSTAATTFQQRWENAQSTATSGNTLGAMVEFEKLIDDPQLATLAPEARAEGARVGGVTAYLQHDNPLARRYLQMALAVDPGDVEALMPLVWVDLSEDQNDLAVTHLLQATAHAREPLEFDTQMVSFLQYTLRDQPARRREVLKALFDNGWKSDGLEPGAFWVLLASLQVDTDSGRDVAATLERVRTPLELITLRSDKRFDRYVDRDDPRYDPERAARQYLDELRVSSLLDRSLDAALVDFSSTQLMLGENEQVVQFSDGIAGFVAEGNLPNGPEAQWLAWLLSNRMIALRRLDRLDDSVATARLAEKVGARGPDHVDHIINLAFMLAATDQLDEAVSVLARLDDLSPYGESAQALVGFLAARKRGDAAAEASARATLVRNRDTARTFHREMLLEEDDLDGAAAALIGQLQSPHDRTEVLLDLQDMRVYPSLPTEVEIDARWRQLKQRADVRAAIAKVGRVERYALYGNASSR